MDHLYNYVDQFIQKFCFIHHFQCNGHIHSRSGFILSILALQFKIHWLEGFHCIDWEVYTLNQFWIVCVTQCQIQEPIKWIYCLWIWNQELLIPNRVSIWINYFCQIQLMICWGLVFVLWPTQFNEASWQSWLGFAMQWHVHTCSNVHPQSPCETHEWIWGRQGVEYLILFKGLLIIDGNDLFAHQFEVHNESPHCYIFFVLSDKLKMLSHTSSTDIS